MNEKINIAGTIVFETNGIFVKNSPKILTSFLHERILFTIPLKYPYLWNQAQFCDWRRVPRRHYPTITRT